MATKELKFKTHFDKREHFYAPGGAKIEYRHRAVIHEDGKRELVPDKAVAIYDLIQASREQCEIEKIIKRAVEGDYNALNLRNGVYMDITDCPNTLAQAQQMIIDLKERFDDLPKEIKSKFNFNAEEYVAEFGSESWAEKTGYKEAILKEQELQRSKIDFDKNMKKAVENLAEGAGTVIKQEGVKNE